MRDVAPTAPGKRLRTAERQRQLLEVAILVFGRLGYAGASMGAIAAEAGISAPALYRHYPNKKALYLAALTLVSERLFATWEQAAADAQTPLVAFTQLGLAYQRLLRDEPHLMQMRFRALSAIEDRDIHALVLSNQGRAEKLLTGIAQRAADEGLLPPGVTVAMLVAGFLAWGAMTDLVSHLGLDQKDGGGVYAQAMLDLMRLAPAAKSPSES